MIIKVQYEDSSLNFAKFREPAAICTQRFFRSKASCFITRIPGASTILHVQ